MAEESPEMLALRDRVAYLEAQNAGLRGGQDAALRRAHMAETRLVETENQLAAARVQLADQQRIAPGLTHGGKQL